MLIVDDLRKGFGSGANRLEVLNGVNMELKTGELVALMGPSGCGKSTLLNIIGGLLPAEGGAITLDGRSYGQKNPSNVVDIRRECVPIIASNMDGVGEVGIAKKLSSFKMMTALTKQHGDKEIKDLGNNLDNTKHEMSRTIFCYT